jgi:hypothetical protein
MLSLIIQQGLLALKTVTCMHEWWNTANGELVKFWTVYCDWCYRNSCKHHVRLFPVYVRYIILGHCGILSVETLNKFLDSCYSWPQFWRSQWKKKANRGLDHSYKLDIGCRNCKTLLVFLILPWIQIYHASIQTKETGQKDSGEKDYWHHVVIKMVERSFKRWRQ